MTNRRSFVASGLLLSCAFSTARARAEGGLEVHVAYTGTGIVDEKHRVYVVIWDNPSFQKADSGPPPIAVQSIALKQGKVRFTGLKASPVYVSLGYDPKGEWHATEAPGPSVWLGAYTTADGKPKPVDVHSGELSKISVTLDNSFRRSPDANGK